MSYSSAILQLLTDGLPTLFERFVDLTDGYVDAWTPESATRYSFKDKEVYFHTRRISTECAPHDTMTFSFHLYDADFSLVAIELPLSSESLHQQLEKVAKINLVDSYINQLGCGTPILDAINAWHQQTIYQDLSRLRTTELKEELVAAAWHPSRVARWISSGADVLDAM